jgi:hypothetical protein
MHGETGMLGFSNPSYREYMGLLSKLKELIARGLDESEQAEEIRHRMDALWPKIPESKRREINKDVRLPPRPE